MSPSLEQLVNTLGLQLPSLEEARPSSSFANDVFEAADDLFHLGTYVLEGSTRVDFVGRARQERELWTGLAKLLRTQSAEDQQRYAAVFDIAAAILQSVEAARPDPGGHLGFRRVIREQFGFVVSEHNFVLVEGGPTYARFSSGDVYLELKWARTPSSSCYFGPEKRPSNIFWVDDLLFMCGDQRYQTLPEVLALDTENDVEHWFTFLAGIFRTCGRDVLSNRPGIFEELIKAQLHRDLEYRQEMDRRYGRRGLP